MKIQSNVKAGYAVRRPNHNQTVTRGVNVKSNVKAGSLTSNHNQTITRGVRVRSSRRRDEPQSDHRPWPQGQNQRQTPFRQKAQNL